MLIFFAFDSDDMEYRNVVLRYFFIVDFSFKINVLYCRPNAKVSVREIAKIK